MYKLSKDYNLLYQMLETMSVVCFVNYDFHRNNTDYVRDVCQCKRTKSNEISFVSRGNEYGSVLKWEIELEESAEYDLFLVECKSLDVEFIPF